MKKLLKIMRTMNVVFTTITIVKTLNSIIREGSDAAEDSETVSDKGGGVVTEPYPQPSVKIRNIEVFPKLLVLGQLLNDDQKDELSWMHYVNKNSDNDSAKNTLNAKSVIVNAGSSKVEIANSTSEFWCSRYKYNFNSLDWAKVKIALGFSAHRFPVITKWTNYQIPVFTIPATCFEDKAFRKKLEEARAKFTPDQLLVAASIVSDPDSRSIEKIMVEFPTVTIRLKPFKIGSPYEEFISMRLTEDQRGGILSTLAEFYFQASKNPLVQGDQS